MGTYVCKKMSGGRKYVRQNAHSVGCRTMSEFKFYIFFID